MTPELIIVAGANGSGKTAFGITLRIFPTNGHSFIIDFILKYFVWHGNEDFFANRGKNFWNSRRYCRNF